MSFGDFVVFNFMKKFKLHGCPIFVGDLAQNFQNWLKTKNYSRVVVLADVNTSRFCLPIFLEKTGLENVSLIEIPAGESHKNLETCQAVWQKMMAEKLDRGTLILLLGGGVVGDLGGFCAATFKRGVDFVQIPTTLLSMTDAAIGGKLGIDFQSFKNMVGVFRHPAAVFADPDFLKTLPPRELISGFGEVIKHACIGSPGLLNRIEKMENLAQADWPKILPKSMSVKIRVVKIDPEERGLRAILNFGHSIGHAIESYFLEKEKPLLHGEAVAVGMICETFLQNPKRAEKLAQLIFRFFPKIDLPENFFPEIWEMMQHDKKNQSGRVRMMLPSDGKFGMEILEPTAADVKKSLEFYQKHVVKNIK